MRLVAEEIAIWADAQLSLFAGAAGVGLPFAASDLLSERARINRLSVPGVLSSGGGCRLYHTRDGAVALNLARADDREMLPALFETAGVYDDAAIAAAMATCDEAQLIRQGREMGLPIAGFREDRGSASPAVEHRHTSRSEAPARPPRVIDLSALWAGPLAARLLRIAGAEVVKVESTQRPDAMREGDPRFFAALNGGKVEAKFDLQSRSALGALGELLDSADIVVESSRPRALLQLGIDADALVLTRPGLIWISITGHGVQGAAAHWVGFGDDCGVAGGLSATHYDATGELSFVGDAIADPLTGIAAARIAAEARSLGEGGRWFLSMSGIAAEALASC